MATVDSDGVEEGETLEALEATMTRHLLGNFLDHIYPHRSTDHSGALDELLAHSEVRTLKKWDTVFRQGEQVDAIYILQKGALAEHGRDVMTMQDIDELDSDNESKCVLHGRAGEVFGTACLYSDCGFQARTTLATTSDSTLLFMSGATLRLHVAMAVRSVSGGGASQTRA